jgi:hypothetical protein
VPSVRRSAASAALGALLFATGCGDPTAPAPADARREGGTPGGFRCADGRDPVAAILGGRVFPGCAASVCHSAEFRAGGLSLVSADLYGELVGRPSAGCGGRVIVADGDPGRSHLIAKVTGAALPSPMCGDPMPLGGPRLSSEDLECLRAWIAARGASSP